MIPPEIVKYRRTVRRNQTILIVDQFDKKNKGERCVCVAGIVAEYNPFHSGHAWQIAQIRRILGRETGIVCVMSGHWVQRGECAITDKWNRTRMALRGGADLVLELPTPWAAAAAGDFARGAIFLLTAAGVVDTLCFGSETGDLALMRSIARYLDSERFQTDLRPFLDRGLPYAACRARAVEGRFGAQAADCLARPNCNLGIEYLRFLPDAITPLALPRIGAEHNHVLPDGPFASGSALRAMLRAGRDADANRCLPAPWDSPVASMRRCERAVLAHLRRMSREDFHALPDSGGGLADRLYSAVHHAASLGQLYALAKTRRYAHARIRRAVLWAFLGPEPRDTPPYLRVLGIGARGRAILRQMHTCATVPVITRPAHFKRQGAAVRTLFEREVQWTDLFALCCPEIHPCGWEWTENPMMEENDEYTRNQTGSNH